MSNSVLVGDLVATLRRLNCMIYPEDYTDVNEIDFLLTIQGLSDRQLIRILKYLNMSHGAINYTTRALYENRLQRKIIQMFEVEGDDVGRGRYQYDDHDDVLFAHNEGDGSEPGDVEKTEINDRVRYTDGSGDDNDNDNHEEVHDETLEGHVHGPEDPPRPHNPRARRALHEANGRMTWYFKILVVVLALMVMKKLGRILDLLFGDEDPEEEPELDASEFTETDWNDRL